MAAEAKLSAAFVVLSALLAASSVQASELPSNDSVPDQSDEDRLFQAVNVEKLRVVLHTPSGGSVSLGVTAHGQAALLRHQAFNATKKHTVVFLPGYSMAGHTGNASRLASAAFMTRYDAINFLSVDWTEYSGPPYIQAVLNLMPVALHLSAWLTGLLRRGLRADGLWLVGYSMGAHLAGSMAANMTARPGRITGLDPAGPLFWGFSPIKATRLRREHATLVDVVHTDAGLGGLGSPAQTGHLDFWPNGGLHQPGCGISQLCSHRRALEYFVESVHVGRGRAFPAARCSRRDFKLGSCPRNDTPVVYMGFAATRSTAEGSFFLHTARRAPYGLGKAGLSLRVRGAEPSAEPTAPTAAPLDEDAALHSSYTAVPGLQEGYPED